MMWSEGQVWCSPERVESAEQLMQRVNQRADK
jgi:hypothetical protein